MLKAFVLIAGLALGLAPVASAQLSSADKAFVMKAAKANNYEIKAAQMANQMSNNDAYKTYADMIATDHTNAGQELTAAVASADPSVQLPTDVSANSQAQLDILKNAGKDFDVKYRDQMIATHQAAIRMFRNYVRRPNDNPSIKQFAEQAIPVFEKHWNDAKKLPKQ